MMDVAKFLYEAFGVQHPRAFIAGSALVGMLLFGGAAWLLVYGYNQANRREVPSSSSMSRAVATPFPAPSAAPSSSGPPAVANSPEERASINIEQHSEGPNSPNIVGNNNQITITEAPPRRSLSSDLRAKLRDALATNPARVRVEVQTGDKEAYDYAVKLMDILKDAGWEVEQNRVQVFMASVLPVEGVLIRYDVNYQNPAEFLFDTLRQADPTSRVEEVPGGFGALLVVLQVGINPAGQH